MGCSSLTLGMSGFNCSAVASKAVCIAVAAVSGVNGVVVVQDLRSSNIREVSRAHRLEFNLLFRRASVVW
jgi:hypothetical protein